MISPKDIKEKIYADTSVKNLVEKLDAALCENKNIKDAICGQVTIKIPELFSPYVTIAIAYLYKEAGWTRVTAEHYSYTTALYSTTTAEEDGFKKYGTKFVFQM